MINLRYDNYIGTGQTVSMGELVKLMKKKTKAIIILLIVLALFAVSPLAPYRVSLGVMSLYSHTEAGDSLMAEKDIDIDIPSADGWYPFVMTFNADSGFRNYLDGTGMGLSDGGIRLSIMYNFPEFDLTKGCSRLYDTDSPYYNAFYGAYCVSGSFGFNDKGLIDRQQAALVPEYDMTRLVLRDLGMNPADEVFEWSAQPDGVAHDDVTSDDMTYELAGYNGWQRVDADLTVNGAGHRPHGWLRNYIQYGSPKYDVSEDFAPVKMKGRIYGRYFEEQDCGIFFYVLACDSRLIDDWENEIMAESTVSTGSMPAGGA